MKGMVWGCCAAEPRSLFPFSLGGTGHRWAAVVVSLSVAIPTWPPTRDEAQSTVKVFVVTGS